MFQPLMPGEHDWMKRDPFMRGPGGFPFPGGMGGGGIFADPRISGGVMGEEAGAPKRDAMMAFAAQLLSGSGASPVRRSFGELVGQAMLAGQQARAVSQDRAQDRRLKDAQIRNLDEPNRAAAPPSVLEYEYAKHNGYKGTFDEWKKVAASTAEAPASIQEFTLAKEQGYKGTFEQWLRNKAQMTPINPSVVNVGNVPTVVQPTRAGTVSTTPLSSEESEREAAAGKAGATAAGKAESERYSVHVDTGLDAADSLSTVKRGIELLDEVKTGGIDVVKLKATNLFGVTGANEAELSAHLGKAVLSQLRATFGAQFTEKEGARLAEIEAGFGKSTEGNRRLLQQAEKILERAARRGIRAAERLGDADTAQEIRDAMQFTLSPGTQPQPGTTPRKRYNPKTGKIE